MTTTDESQRRPAKGPRIGFAQLSPALGDTAANLELHRAAIEKAGAEGCELVIFPELSLTGYRLKDSVPEVAIKRGSDTWKQLEGLSATIAIVVGFVEESADHLFYNSAAYFEGGRCVAVHRKSYLPTYGMFDEQRYFARGRGIAAFDTKCGRVAMLVCEDLLHPSAVTIAACDGATLIVCPSASPARGVVAESEADSNAKSWEGYLHVMARSFGVWIAYCNRVGVEDGVSFWGGSELVSPAGETLVKAAYYDDDFVAAVMSEDAVRRRRIVNPLVRDEDLDLTINELSRIRGRAVDKAPREQDKASREQDKAPRSRDRDAGDGERPPRRFDRDAPPRGAGRDAPRSFDRDAPRSFDRDAPPRRFDRDAPPRRFDRDAPRGGDGPPRSFDRDAPRKFDRDAPPRRFDRDAPRGGDGPPRRFDRDAPPRRFDRDTPPRDFAGDGPPRRPREGFGGFKPPFRPRFGAGGDAPARPRFGAPRDDAPRGRGKFGGGGGFGPPRAAAEGGFAGKPRFGDPRPRDRQRPEPRKPFHKGAKPRGRKDR